MVQFMSYAGPVLFGEDLVGDERPEPGKGPHAAARDCVPGTTISATGSWPWPLTLLRGGLSSTPSGAPAMRFLGTLPAQRVSKGNQELRSPLFCSGLDLISTETSRRAMESNASRSLP